VRPVGLAATPVKCSADSLLATRPRYWRESQTRGFSLLEILVVVALVALLLSIALPQYQSYLERGYRVEAIRMLTSAAACQERHRARTGAYDPARCGGSNSNDHYRLYFEQEENSSSTGFTLTAEPVRQRTNDKCGSLSLDQAGTRGISGPAGNLSKCWSGR